MSRLGVLMVALTMTTGRAAFAKDLAATMAELQDRVKPGTEVDLVDRAGRTVRGQFVRADGEGVLVAPYGRAESHRVPAGDVYTVSRPGDSVVNGALIGGALVAVPIALLADGPRDFASREVVSIVATYASIGALIDLAFKGRTLVYRAPGPRVSLSVTPHPVAGGAGVRVAVGF